MTRLFKHTIPLLLLAALLSQCKDRYDAPHISPTAGYLVVEGYITGNGPTRFTLSRTIPLSDSRTLKPETNAQLQVEGDDNSSWPLAAQTNGTYGIDTLPLNPAVKYRLRIHTAGGKDYLSDYAPLRSTPAIDSINWAITLDGVGIFANTHDPSSATRYYQWAYEETWQYYSARVSNGKYVAPPPDVIYRTYDEQIYVCWGSGIATALLLGSSDKLSQDVIYRHLLKTIPGGSIELATKYSILVKQYALTEDAYNYLTLMQKNSESLGSIFDAQPSFLKGNIHCLSAPTEQVIGYISVGTMQQQRIFIEARQIPAELQYRFSCPANDRIVTMDSLEFFFAPGKGYTPIDQHFSMLTGMVDGWNANFNSCVDCRVRGGVTTKPSFWPN